MYDMNDPVFKRWYIDVKRGRITLRMIADLGLRVAVENKLIEDYAAGKLPDKAVDALIQWKLIQIHNTRITIDDVDERIRGIVQKAIDDNVDIQFIQQ